MSQALELTSVKFASAISWYPERGVRTGKAQVLVRPTDGRAERGGDARTVRKLIRADDRVVAERDDEAVLLPLGAPGERRAERGARQLEARQAEDRQQHCCPAHIRLIRSTLRLVVLTTVSPAASS